MSPCIPHWEPRKNWIEYEDGSFEPTNPQEDINRKKRGQGRPDWWVVNQTPNWLPDQFADTRRGRNAARAARAGMDHRTEHERHKERHKERDKEQNGGLGKVYWTVHPKPEACDKCQALKGIRFQEKPQRPHPNCKCEIRRSDSSAKDDRSTGVHVIKQGTLEGFEAHEDLYFGGGQVIYITIENKGKHVAGVHIIVDEAREASTGHLIPGSSDTFRFDKFGELPVPWHVRMMVLGGDNTWFSYEICSNA
ncbi:MAG: hypothetical protein AB7D51_00520 [Desulfovibrionaceae bacterium]